MAIVRRPSLQALTSDLRHRLLLLLLVPLCLLALAGVWLDYQSADVAAERHDQKLLRLLPALTDSVLAQPRHAAAPPLLLLAPPVEDFLHQNPQTTAFSVRDGQGQLLFGSDWVDASQPSTSQAEFHSVERSGVTYRVAVQRDQSEVGDVVVALADGSDPRQNWAQQLVARVLLPNLILVAAAALSIGWAVRRAFAPLVALTDAVERRSPRDLSPIDEQASPSEVRPLVRSLNRLFATVNEQAQSQQRFIADAAHQLRTPLAGLQAQVEAWGLIADMALERQASHPSQKLDQKSGLSLDYIDDAAISIGVDQVKKLRVATRRTSQLAHQLLALSRADARNINAQTPQRVDLKAVCEALLEAFWETAHAKNIDLGLEVQACYVTGHAWLLRELVSNLLDNAVRYALSGGVVTLRCGYRWTNEATADAGSRFAYLEIEDSGPGIPDEEKCRVVERFYRVPGVQGEGTGLGLAFAQEIAQLHQAVMTLNDAQSGSGLLVVIEFPMVPISD